MSNIGFERYLGDLGIKLLRTAVGDKYVVQKMRDEGCNLGGEQSGHIVATDFATTGDGLIASLQICSALADCQCAASELLNVYTPVPQKTVNAKYRKNNDPLENNKILAEIKKAESKISPAGRLVVRKSGTEPLLRIMGEHENEDLLNEVLWHLAGTVSENY